MNIKENNKKQNKEWKNVFFLKYSIASSIISSIIGLILIFYATTLWKNFNWISKTISNLGNPENSYESSPILNGAYILAAIGNIPFFTYFMHKTIRDTNENFAKVGFFFLILSCVFMGLLGFITEYWLQQHRMMSLLFFISLLLGLLLISFSWIGRKFERKYAIFNFIIILIVSSIWYISENHLGFWTNDAIPELISILAFISVILVYIYKSWFRGIGIH